MKIRCDVCEKEEASVFCTADEASLCDGCDRRVHRANKLASKHPRFSLFNPSFKDSPRCDICQERRAFLFCKEDRAILCRECDVPIHTANEHTQKHNRFLLTGVKLAASSSTSSHRTPSSSIGSTACTEPDIKTSASKDIYRPVPTKRVSESVPLSSSDIYHHRLSQDGVSVSSISEYLMETLPGWQVDEFLGPSSRSHPHGFCKSHDGETGLTNSEAECVAGYLTSGDFAFGGPQSWDFVFPTDSKTSWNLTTEEPCMVPFVSPSSFQRSTQW